MKRLIIIIPAYYQEQANQLATQLDTGGAGQFTFTTGLNPSGIGTATHYWCSTICSEAQYQMILGMHELLPEAQIVEWDMEAAPSYPETLLDELALKQVIPDSFMVEMTD